MKINTIYHSQDEMTKERKNDIRMPKIAKDPIYHPFIKEREIVRAINASKIDRLLSKPFITSLSFHKEGIFLMKRHLNAAIYATASFDNEIIVSDLNARSKIFGLQTDQKINGIAIDDLNNFYVGFGKCVKRFSYLKHDVVEEKGRKDDGQVNMKKILHHGDQSSVNYTPNMHYNTSKLINDVEWYKDLYVCMSSGVEVFDSERYSPKFNIDIDNPEKVVCNRSLNHLIAVCTEKNMQIADIRIGKVVHDVSVGIKTNSISFNQMEGHFLASGNEDFNGYIHDIRYLENPFNILRGHVNPVTSIAFSPTGEEIVTGSYDRTLRIYKTHERKSRDVYYNKRMHNVTGVDFTHDGEFIVNASDDGSLRVWKANASKRTGYYSKKEKNALVQQLAIKSKYKELNEVKRISKHRFIPKKLKNRMKQLNEHHMAQERRKQKSGRQ